MQPEFGCKLRALCFEQINESLPTRIEEEIKRSVSNWLPYINIIEVQTLTEEGDKNKIFVKLKYSTILTPESMQQITLDTSYSATRF
jgi:phage baseplate assembly protein W